MCRFEYTVRIWGLPLSASQHALLRPLPNGHPGDPTGGPRLSVPKMGVRARIAEWPPRRSHSRESLLENGGRDRHAAPGRAADGGLVRGGVARLPRRRAKEDEYHGGASERGSMWNLRAFPPLRQRSNSEMTLSEQDELEVEGHGGGLGQGSLYREYGSTSSIDVQGLSEQSFLDMLHQLHQERPPQHGPPGGPPRTLAAPAGPSPQPAAGEGRVRKKSGGTESSLGSSSLFRKLRSSSRGELDRGDPGEEGPGRAPMDPSYRPWVCPKSFVHFDAQSVLFDLHAAAAARGPASQRRNTATGASASRGSTAEPAFPSTDDLTLALGPAGPGAPEPADPPHGGPGPQLLLCCPHFLNETGGHGERNVSFLSSGGEGGEGGRGWLRRSNASVAVLEVPIEQRVTRLDQLKLYSLEHVDLGAKYYRDYFHGKEHSNYFGTDDKLGPVALSIRREKLDDTKDLKDQYQYRLIVRTSELVTLRGSILEDAVASTARHGAVRGLPLKEVLEQVVPELSASCLRLALSTPKVTEQLLKLDEQGLSQKHKVGVLLCRAGQSTEEEMYNNEEASPAFSSFLELLGQQVLLKGFSKYAAQLDTKTDSTGTHSLYTEYQDYEIMFHVSTMLPYMPNNPQQLLRKRHIGNDIVTIVFQEPGALPFTPQNILSHFQHVFVIVRVHNPCSENTFYSVAVTRMKDVPPFGPPIPSGVAFRDPDAFRSFLLAKVLNAETAAHKSDKFHTMATRTRQEYLRDLAENCVSGTPMDSAGKLNNLISLASKKRERARAREGAELGAAGAVAWRVLAQDFSGGGAEMACALGLSEEYVLLVDQATKEVVFNCFCSDVIGWTAERLALKVFYGRGDYIAVRVAEGCAQDIREVVQRLKPLTVGCETVDMTLRRNGLGQLGFHVRLDGTVAEVEEYGFAWQAGLRQGSRLVEICKVAAVTLTHEQMIDLLRTSVTVKVVIIPPYEEGGPRRGCTEEYEMKTMEQKPEPEPVAVGYRPSPRPPGCRWDSPPLHGTPPHPQRWAHMGPPAPPLPRAHKTLVAVPYRETHHGSAKRPVSYPENQYTVSPAGGDFSSPSPGLLGPHGAPGLGPFLRYKPSPDRCVFVPGQRPLVGYEPPMALDVTSSGESSSGFTSQESTMERCKPEPVWHVPVPSRGMGAGGGQRRPPRHDVPGKDSPNRHSKGEAQYSSHSSSNTLSSNASSGHSDERWFDGAPRGGEGGSSDSGIDAPPHFTHHARPPPAGPGPSHKPLTLGVAGSGEGRRRESSPANQNKGYRTRTFPPPGSSADKADPFHRRQVELNSKNVFGQPRLRASLRDLRSPRRTYKSTVEDDLKKLIIMDYPVDSPRRPLQRTFSDESLCSGRRDASYAAAESVGAPADVLFTCTLPTRKPHGPPPGGQGAKKAALSSSELSLVEGRDQVPPLRRLDPGLMPLPDTSGGGLEWTSLVSAARAYEVSFIPSCYCVCLLSDEVNHDLPGRLHHLEVKLRQLNTDLEKEKKDKVVLMAEMADLRQNNQRLQEESSSASEQLRKFSITFKREDKNI
uniref:Signal-induced proliferation-associated 1 like 3 n=1 Tax=Gadus morhua TaxID=8049 RepID=A0A8C5A5D1_GADMO